MATKQTVLVSGAAGFIGSHVVRQLVDRGYRVVGIDNLNDYYDVSLKAGRVADIETNYPSSAFEFHRISVEDEASMLDLAASIQPASIVHLAAQAGVRHSLNNPMAYARANLMGMTVMLQVARMHGVKHMVYASSSSVYGGNAKKLNAESDRVDSPISFYAATKRANELMASSYAHLFNIPMTGLRFFTVYGPWGRPDMAYWLFTDSIMKGQPIRVFGEGKLLRAFTYIDDVADGVCRVLESPATPDEDGRPNRVLNIGKGEQVSVLELVRLIEQYTNRKATIQWEPMQPGDVETTMADTSALESLIGFSPQVSIEQGLEQFVHWYSEYVSTPAHRKVA